MSNREIVHGKKGSDNYKRALTNGITLVIGYTPDCDYVCPAYPADATPTIVSALAALAPGGTLLFREGTFHLGSVGGPTGFSITSNITVQGQGKSTVWEVDPTLLGKVRAYNVGLSAGATLADISVSQINTNVVHTISVDAENVTIRDCFFETNNGNTTFVWIASGGRCKLIGNRFNFDNNPYGVMVSVPSIISNNTAYCSGLGNQGIFVWVRNSNADGSIIANNNIYCNIGVKFDGVTGNILIHGNNFTGCASSAIETPPVATKVRDNVGTDGTLMPNSPQAKITGISGATVVDSFADTLGDGCIWEYVVKDGVNLRTGTIMAAWDNTETSVPALRYTEVSTNDVGDTSPLVLSVANNSNVIELTATPASGTWTVKVERRLL